MDGQPERRAAPGSASHGRKNPGASGMNSGMALTVPRNQQGAGWRLAAQALGTARASPDYALLQATQGRQHHPPVRICRCKSGSAHRGLMKDVRQLIRPRPFGHISENVKMRPSDAEKVSEPRGAANLRLCVGLRMDHRPRNSSTTSRPRLVTGCTALGRGQEASHACVGGHLESVACKGLHVPPAAPNSGAID